MKQGGVFYEAGLTGHFEICKLFSNALPYPIICRARDLHV